MYEILIDSYLLFYHPSNAVMTPFWPAARTHYAQMHSNSNLATMKKISQITLSSLPPRLSYGIGNGVHSGCISLKTRGRCKAALGPCAVTNPVCSAGPNAIIIEHNGVS